MRQSVCRVHYSSLEFWQIMLEVAVINQQLHAAWSTSFSASSLGWVNEKLAINSDRARLGGCMEISVVESKHVLLLDEALCMLACCKCNKHLHLLNQKIVNENS